MPERNSTRVGVMVSSKLDAPGGSSPPTDEPLGQAERGIPLLRVVHHLVVDLLDVAFLILGGEKREQRRNLIDAAPVPAFAASAEYESASAAVGADEAR